MNAALIDIRYCNRFANRYTPTIPRMCKRVAHLAPLAGAGQAERIDIGPGLVLAEQDRVAVEDRVFVASRHRASSSETSILCLITTLSSLAIGPGTGESPEAIRCAWRRLIPR